MIKKILTVDLQIRLLSGMHIGGSDSSFDIGGADSSVFKDPLTKRPVIPGSSLKGKLRSLLTYDDEMIDGDDITIRNDVTRNLFESVEMDPNTPSITRALFRDMTLTEDSARKITDILGDGVYTEIKAENSIDKLKGTAKSPRFIERVPAGAEFEGQIVLTVFDGDDEEKMKSDIEKALNLLELNYIGGSGSRGYGRVKVLNLDS
ncbi:MAG: type III-A CRISPR-associated RAMP protein Csm3, partial [Holdemanella biformis]|nr:type III-A CRISPR-associated RAMP protein Csm3 [Holdemanella biformis]